MTFDGIVILWACVLVACLVLCIALNKTCPFCKVFIPRSATRCKQCCADLPPRKKTP
jgi:predicted amidophosphoribosyltransferase